MNRVTIPALLFVLSLAQVNLGMGTAIYCTNSERGKEILRLADSTDPAAFDQLLAALGDADLDVRVLAAQMLVQRNDQRAAGPLRALIQDENMPLRRIGVMSLWVFPAEDSVDQLLALANDADPCVRMSVVQGIARFRDDPRAVEVLLAAMSDKTADVRGEAANALTDFEDERVSAALAAALGDADSNVRFLAAHALVKRSDPRGTEAMLLLVNDSNPSVSAYAVETLGRLKDPRFTDVLLSALNSEKGYVRLAALHGLSKIADARILDAIAAKLDDKEVAFRIEVARVLVEKGDPRGTDALLPLLTEPENIAAPAIKALGPSPDPRALDPLLAALASESIPIRRASAQALIFMGDKRAAEPLMKLIDEKDQELRRMGLESLQRFPGVANRFDILADALKSEDAAVRETAMNQLCIMDGPRKADVMLSALKDPESSIRSLAVWGLDRLPADERFVEPLLAALKDENESVRLASVEALRKWKDARLLEPLCAALGDPYAPVAERAAYYLGALGDARAVSALLEALKHQDANVRSSAAGALGVLGDKSASESLIGLLEDPENRVREACIYSLGRLRDERSAAAMAKLFEDPDRGIRIAAASTIVRLPRTPSTVDAMLKGLESDDPAVQSQLLESFSVDPDPRTFEPLTRSLKSQDPEIRRSSARVLSLLKDPRALAPIAELLHDENAGVHEEVSEALKRFEIDGAWLDAVLKALEGETPEGKLAAVKLLSWPRESFVIAPFLELLKGEDVELRQAAIEGLTKFAEEPRVFDACLPFLQDEDRKVRRAAATAIGRSRNPLGVKPLLEMLKEDDPVLQSTVASALGNFAKRPEVADALFALANSENADLRRAVTRSLARAGDTRAIGPLLEDLKSDDKQVRLRAAMNLLKMKDAKAHEAVLEAFAAMGALKREILNSGEISNLSPQHSFELVRMAMEEASPDVRQSVVYAVSVICNLPDAEMRRGPIFELLAAALAKAQTSQERVQWLTAINYNHAPRAVDLQEALLNDPDEEVRALALRGLGWSNDNQKAHGILMGILKDDTKPQADRVNVAVFLAMHHGDSSGLDLLLQALSGPPPHAGMAAQGFYSLRDPRAVEPLIALLKIEVGASCASVARALGNQRDSRAVEPLIAKLSSEDDLVNCAVAQALGMLRDKRAVEPLLPLLTNDNEQVRTAAADALEKIGINHPAE